MIDPFILCIAGFMLFLSSYVLAGITDRKRLDWHPTRYGWTVTGVVTLSVIALCILFVGIGLANET